MGLIISYCTSRQSTYETRAFNLEKRADGLRIDVSNLFTRIEELEMRVARQNVSTPSTESGFRFPLLGRDYVLLKDPRKLSEFRCSDDFDPEFSKTMNEYDDEEVFMKDNGIKTELDLEEFYDRHRIYSAGVVYDGNTYNTKFATQKEWEDLRENLQAWIMTRFN